MKLRLLILTARIGRSRMTEWKLEGDRFQINRKKYLLTMGGVKKWSGLLWEGNIQSVEAFEQRLNSHVAGVTHAVSPPGSP